MAIERRTVIKGGLAAIGALAAPAVVRAQGVTLRLHHFNSPLSLAHTRFLTPWAEKVMNESDGALKVEVFPAMQLGGRPGDLYAQAKDGIVDMVWTIPGYTANRFHLTEVFELPFVASSARATAPAAHEFAARHMAEEYADTHPILFHTHPPGNIHTNSVAVRGLEDLQGLQIRGPSRPITQALEAMGAVPVGMPVPAVTESVSRGVVEGAALPWGIARPIRLHEVTNYHTIAEFYALVFAMVMNKRRWEALPAELKQVIEANSTLETVRGLGRLWDDDEVEGLRLARDKGNEIIQLSDAERGRWRAACRPVVDAWIEKIDGMGLDGEALYAEASELIAANAA